MSKQQKPSNPTPKNPPKRNPPVKIPLRKDIPPDKEEKSWSIRPPKK